MIQNNFHHNLRISQDPTEVFNLLDKFQPTPLNHKVSKEISQQKNKYLYKPHFSKLSPIVINDDVIGSICRLGGHRRTILNYIYQQCKYRSVVYVKQDTIAAACGVTRRTVSRAITQFKSLGLLDVGTRYRESCVYSIPVAIKESSQFSTIYSILCPEWAKYRLIEGGVSLNIYRDLLLSVSQDNKLRFTNDGRNPYEFGSRSSPVHDVVGSSKSKKRTKSGIRREIPINGNEESGVVMNMSDNKRQSIVELRQWLHLTVADEDKIAQYSDEVITEASRIVRGKKVQHPLAYYLGTCKQLQFRQEQQSVFNTSTTTTKGRTSSPKPPMYKPYQPKERLRENPLDAAVNLQRNREKMIANLSFMGQERAGKWVDDLIASYFKEHETGESQDRTSFTGTLIGGDMIEYGVDS